MKLFLCVILFVEIKFDYCVLSVFVGKSNPAEEAFGYTALGVGKIFSLGDWYTEALFDLLSLLIKISLQLSFEKISLVSLVP